MDANSQIDTETVKCAEKYSKDIVRLNNRDTVGQKENNIDTGSNKNNVITSKVVKVEEDRPFGQKNRQR